MFSHDDQNVKTSCLLLDNSQEIHSHCIDKKMQEKINRKKNRI